MQRLSSLLLCTGMWMIVNECDPLAVHDIGCHTEQQIKRLRYTSSPFLMPFLFSSRRLPTYLNHPSPVWWIPHSSAPYTNEQSHNAYLMFFCCSLSISFSFSLLSPSPHVCIESLYGDSTDKPVLDCCACGTAKYRVTFFGNWSEKIHPKDYPRKHKLLCSLSCRLSSIAHLILIVALQPQNV